ncbi:MAG: reverse transcriptase/maturase family protein [Minisyncoccales bacterium]
MTEMCKVVHGIEIPKSSKRYGHLFELAFTKQNIYDAYLDARKNKRNKVGTFLFETSLGLNIELLYNELHSGTYASRGYREFIVYEPKQRVIQAPHFRDLVVQHAIYRVIYNIFNKSFVNTSFACRKSGGTHKASIYTQTEMRKYDGNLYYAKLDVRKFFYSIHRDVLRKLFEKKIKDARLVDVMMLFADTKSSEIGIPIGNLLSQLYSLIYMNEMDNFVKRTLKVKSYVRYVDDFVLIGLTLEEAKNAKQQCEEYLRSHLKMELSHWTISKIRKGINFVGYRTWKFAKFVRKHSMYNFLRAVKKRKFESIVSLIGHASATKTLVYYKQILIDFGLLGLLPKGSRKCLSF